MPHALANISDVFAGLACTKGRLGYAASNMLFDAWQAQLREQIVDVLRLPVLPIEPPKVEIITSEDCGTYVREKIVMRASDDLGVPAYVLRPVKARKPRPGILAIPSHGPGKSVTAGIPPACHTASDSQGDQLDYALQAVHEDMIAGAPDLRGLGELVLDDESSRQRGNSCVSLASRAVQTGRTLMGMRIGDLMQLVDWLESREDVDPKRICVTGHGVGGMAALFLGAVDIRIRAVVLSGSFCSFQSGLLATEHCACNYVPDLSTLAEIHDIGGLIAPRFLLVVSGRDDNITPIEGVRSAFAELEKLYAAAGARHCLDLRIGEGGHRYYRNFVWPFISRALSAIP